MKTYDGSGRITRYVKTEVPAVVPSHPKIVRRDTSACLLSIANDILGTNGKCFGGPTALSSLRATIITYILAQILQLACAA